MTWISREALFEKAWAQPLTQVAAEFGVTSTALKKTCDPHDIPTPGRGYWAQVAAGKHFPRPKLRPLRDGQLGEVRIVGVPPLPPAVIAAQARARALSVAPPPSRPAPIAAPQAPSALPAPAPAQSASPDLAATARALARARPDPAGFLRVAGKGRVGLVIGEPSVGRALAWLERLAQAAAGQGGRLQPTEGGMALVVDGEAIGFRLEDKPARTPHAPTPKELKGKAERLKWGWNSDPWPKYDHAPSGELSLMIEGNSYSGLRRTYSDGKTRRLEQMLGDILAAFAGHAALTQTRRREAGESARRAAEAQARRQQLEAFEAREARRQELVDAVHVRLAERARLAQVLAHLEATAQAGEGRLDAMAGWLRRRLQQLDALLSPTFVDLSARRAEIEFDEIRDRAAADGGVGRYYWRKPELLFWSLDPEKDLATSQSALDWAAATGLLPPLQP